MQASLTKPRRRKPRKLCSFRGVCLVRLAGIEPTTPWFVAKYSIQLSYSREALYSSSLSVRFLFLETRLCKPLFIPAEPYCSA
ncbi:MAG: hypothetical protein RLZZ352_2337 [Pseudomonadota bacterium]